MDERSIESLADARRCLEINLELTAMTAVFEAILSFPANRQLAILRCVAILHGCEVDTDGN